MKYNHINYVTERILYVVVVQLLSPDSVTPWTVAHQAPHVRSMSLSMLSHFTHVQLFTAL